MTALEPSRGKVPVQHLAHYVWIDRNARPGRQHSESPEHQRRVTVNSGARTPPDTNARQSQPQFFAKFGDRFVFPFRGQRGRYARAKAILHSKFAVALLKLRNP